MDQKNHQIYTGSGDFFVLNTKKFFDFFVKVTYVLLFFVEM